MQKVLLLLALIAVVALVAAPAMAVTISSPLNPPVRSTNLSLSSPPVFAPGLCLGWGVAEKGKITGTIAYNFTFKKLAPVTFDVFMIDNFKEPAVGVAIPLSAVTNAVGFNAGPTWTPWLNALSGGVWGGVKSGKADGGLYARLTIVAAAF